MPSGRLGIAAPTANTNTTIYTVPAGMVATLNVAVVNRGTDAASVRVAIASSGTPTNAEFIEYAVTVPGNGGVLERTAIVAGAGERVVVHCSTEHCSVRVHGYEEGV